MHLTIPISAKLEERLVRFARDAGMTADTLAGRLLERTLSKLPDLSEVSGPVGEEFRKSGMSEDELSELLEAEKHAMRADRREKGRG